MKEQVAMQVLLRKRLSEIQHVNPGYSLRAFAKRTGIDAGALSHILNGRRNVSRKLAERVSKRLMLDPQERSELLGLFPKKTPYRKPGELLPPPTSRYLELTASQFKISAEWEHFALLSLLNCKNFKESPEWIADRLGISVARAKEVLERLFKLELIARDESGRLVRSHQSFRTTDDVADISLKKHHDQSLDLAKQSLFRDSVANRDFTTITMAIDPKKLDAAKEMIRKHQDELSDLLESGDRTEVYRLSIQLFPLSKMQTQNGEQK